ncbi:PadR family transcriptional regulator [Amycolatopsis pigmentata]|uniref:PadR family transcriptional regulator n=1 Tax=Amycolatopsis pigmentata TaxID=450801 RepID=A0ABW5G449_9PSEU
MKGEGQLSPVVMAVLALLAGEPMHVYRMQQLIKERGVDMVVNVRNRSGLYAAIERLARDELIDVHAVERDTRHPERTVYALTPRGRDALLAGLRQSLASPNPEFPSFPAAVSFLYLLSPYDARRQLSQRAEELDTRLAGTRRVIAESVRHGVPRLYLLEHQYTEGVIEAELNWIRTVCADIDAGTLTWEEHFRTS